MCAGLPQRLATRVDVVGKRSNSRQRELFGNMFFAESERQWRVATIREGFILRKILSILLAFSLILHIQISNVQSATARPGVSARGAILIEQQSGRVLFGHNHRERLGPASTTKIMTAIVALEHDDISDMVTVSEHAAAVEGSSIWLEENERISLEYLLFGLIGCGLASYQLKFEILIQSII